MLASAEAAVPSAVATSSAAEQVDGVSSTRDDISSRSIPSAPSSSGAAALSLTFRDLVVSTAPTPTLAQRAFERVQACGTRHPPTLPPPAPSAPIAGTKYILRRASGFIPARSLTAVMGGSGAGKTTLLNFLAHRLAGCGAAHRPPEPVDASLGGYRVSGSIQVNGRDVTNSFFAKVCAYVPQQSILLSSLTPRESILFASRLRLPHDTPPEEHEANADRVLAALSLQSCANTRIGDELTGGGLSGGEKRRVNIGVELVTNPPLLCLDEPTTGLDSLTALNVLKSLKALTGSSPTTATAAISSTTSHSKHHSLSAEPGSPPDPLKSEEKSAQEQLLRSTPSSASGGGAGGGGGATVVCSIHQPSCEMFDLFDSLILLASGVVVYCGSAKEAIAYFGRLSYPCPPLENPPEYFLDLILTHPPLLDTFDREWREAFERRYGTTRRVTGAATADVGKKARTKQPTRAAVAAAAASLLAGEEAEEDEESYPVGSPAILRPTADVDAGVPPSPSSQSSLVSSPASASGTPGVRSPCAAFRGTTAGPPPPPPLPPRLSQAARISAKAHLWSSLHRVLARDDDDHDDDGDSPVEVVAMKTKDEPGHHQQQQQQLVRVDEIRGIQEEASSLKQGVPLPPLPPPSSPPPPITALRTRLARDWSHLRHLTHRAYLNSSRMPLLKGAQVLQTLVLGLLVGLAFLRLGSDQVSVQNRLGAVYFINICVIFANTLSVVLTFSEERSLFLREQGNRMYSVWTYYLARLSIEIVPTFLCSLGLALICFWMIDPSASGSEFGQFLLLVSLLAYAGQGIGLVVSCGIASRMLAMIVTPLAIAPFILFTPYAVDYDHIPPYFRPFQVGSPFWWGFTGLMITMFDGLHFHCTSDQYVTIPLSDGSTYLLCPYTTGVGVLAQFDIHLWSSTGENQFWLCCGLLLLLSVIYRVIALLMLYKLALDVKDATK